jgi:hypothetical protein
MKLSANPYRKAGSKPPPWLVGTVAEPSVDNALRNASVNGNSFERMAKTVDRVTTLSTNWNAKTL